MSENPYAPPQAALATPLARAEGTGTVDLSLCMQEAWRNTWANFPLWLGAGLVWTLALVASVASIAVLWRITAIAGVLAGLGMVLVVPVLYWGAYVLFLQMHDGGASLGDLFSGFSRYGQALVGMSGYFVLNLLISAPPQIVIQIGARPPPNGWLVGIGYLGLLAITLFVQSRLKLFVPFLIVDRGLGIGAAFRESWSRTAELKGSVALLTVVMFFVIIAGMVALLVGVIPATVVAFLMWASAYRQIFGGARAN